jgi:hypothetical protein
MDKHAAMVAALSALVDAMDERQVGKLKKTPPEEMDAANDPMAEEDAEAEMPVEDEEDEGAPKALLAIIAKKKAAKGA